VRHRGIWTPADRAAGPYRTVPFDVPPGCAGVAVSLSYDRSAGVLDLGCAGPGGFRGWSGAARDRFAITASGATPGYLPGPLEPGQWQVWLGLHRVPPGGLAFEIEVATGAAAGRVAAGTAEPDGGAPGPAERPPRRDLPAPPDSRWLAGDLHSHTVHSDGVLSVGELAATAAAAGLDYLAVTDHNTTSHHPALAAAGRRAGVLLLPGQEVTTDRGHACAFGDIGWIDFRTPAQEWVSEVARRGGLLSINHPLAGDCAWLWPLAQRPPLAEIWHWTWLDGSWGGPLAWWAAFGLDTVPVGGSDFHDPGQGRPLGRPLTWVLCEGGDVLGGLRAGRTAISAARDGPVLLRVGGELIAVDAEGLLLTDPAGRRRPVPGNPARFPAAPGPHWLEDHRSAVQAITA
jgi:hypothetical protein